MQEDAFHVVIDVLVIALLWFLFVRQQWFQVGTTILCTRMICDIQSASMGVRITSFRMKISTSMTFMRVTLQIS